jgi:hypothetical protein
LALSSILLSAVAFLLLLFLCPLDGGERYSERDPSCLFAAVKLICFWVRTKVLSS